MRCFLIIVIASAAMAFAEDSGKPNSPASGSDKTSVQDSTAQDSTAAICKLGMVTWNPETEELSWVVTLRPVTSDDAHPVVEEKYTIKVNGAVMTSQGEGRHLDPDEAKRVLAVMNLISNYAVESTVWWSNGEGEKVNDSETAPSGGKGSGTPDKPKPEAEPRVPAGARSAQGGEASSGSSHDLR